MTMQAGDQNKLPKFEAHKDRPEEKLTEARDRIRRAFEAKRVHLGNSHSQNTNDGTIMELIDPVDALGRKWKAQREAMIAQSTNDTELLALQADHVERLDKVVKLVESYINGIAARHGGWLDAAAMAEISSSINRNSALYTHILINANPRMFKVIQVIMGQTVEGKSRSEELQKALPEMADIASFEMTRGDKGVMPCIWMLTNFLTRPERITFGIEYSKGKTLQQVEEFLRYGNARGVLSADEMEAIMASYTQKPDYKFEDRDALRATWGRVNNLQKKIARLSNGVYGSQNDAGSMINFKNALITLGQLVTGATAAANLAFGAWNGGKLRDPKSLVKTVTNPIVWWAGAGYKGLGMLRNNERFDRVFEGKESREDNKRKQALQLLKAEKNGNVLWDKWESFFAADGKGGSDFGGAKAFYDFLLYTKRQSKSPTLPEGQMTTSKFLEYLKAQAASQKPERAGLDYKGLLEQFKELSPPTILNLAQAFDTLSIGGNDAGDKFQSVMKQVDQA